MNKRPIDIERDSGGKFRIGFQDDGTPITEMLQLNDGLLVVTKKAVYEVKVADQIDPKRENPNIPHNVQRRILELGTDSELVGRILLTAKSLFKQEFLPSSINVKQALTLSFEALRDMVAMQTTATEYELAEKKEVEAAESRVPEPRSLAIPSIADVKTRCKTFFQKADHVEQTMWDLVRVFYPNIQAKCYFDSLRDFVKDKYGSDDDFAKFIDEALPFIKMVRNARDCLDHRNAKGVVVTDFALSADGKIARPAIEIKFRETHQPPADLISFMPEVVEKMSKLFENLIAFLCSKNAQSFAGIPVQVGAISENRRRNKNVQYSFGVIINGEFAPIG